MGKDPRERRSEDLHHVWARDRIEYQLVELVEVKIADNGLIDVLARWPNGGQQWRGWWRWSFEGASDFNGVIDELSRLPGWQPEMREKVIESVVLMRARRRRSGGVSSEATGPRRRDDIPGRP